MSRSTVARRASTTLVVRDGPSGLEVLMVRRSLTASFMPGSYVFPGGALDDADASPALRARCTESPEALGARVRTPGLAPGVVMGHALAALRECFEECGLWLGAAPQTAAAALQEARQRLLGGRVGFAALAAELDLPLDTAALAPWSRWITPIDLPKRFDTLFFVALAPAGQRPAVDEGETIGLNWVSPTQALAASAGGSFPVEFATAHTLTSLQPYACSALLMRAAHEPRWLTPLEPRVARTEQGERRILLPQDAGYEEVMRLDPDGRGDAVIPQAQLPGD